MNIAVNARLLIESRMEGIARYNYESLKCMVLDHPEDKFYFFFDRPYSEEFIFAKNVIPIKVIPPTRHPLLIMYWFEWAIYRKLKSIQPDVFLSGDTYMSLKTKIPTLLVSHDLAYIHYPGHIPKSHRMYYKYYFPKFHKKAKALIAVSEFTKNDIIKHYKIPAQQITVAYNAPNGTFYPIDPVTKAKTQEKLTQGRPYFVYLGSIHPRKNLENLIKGFDHFKENMDSDHCLVIIGRPAWNTESFYKTMDESPYKADIIHTQFKRSELPEYIGSAEALCYISLFEGFGIPILEGFEAGVPVITSNVSSMPEVAKDAAIKVDPEDPFSIGSAFDQIANNAPLRKRLIEKGKNRLKDFSWQRTSEIIYGKLEELGKNM